MHFFKALNRILFLGQFSYCPCPIVTSVYILKKRIPTVVKCRVAKGDNELDKTIGEKKGG